MRLRALIIFILMLAMPRLTGQGHAAGGQPTEYQLKAAYVYHFAQFVDWPSSAFKTSNSPLIIGILGDNPFGASLEHTVDGKVLNHHPLSVMAFRSVSEISNNCHVLFISSSEKKRFSEIFAALKGQSILTVGEADRFTESGGMVNFVIEDDKIRFQINESTVKNAGLNMSFKLLSLASKVTH